MALVSVGGILQQAMNQQVAQQQQSQWVRSTWNTFSAGVSGVASSARIRAGYEPGLSYDALSCMYRDKYDNMFTAEAIERGAHRGITGPRSGRRDSTVSMPKPAITNRLWTYGVKTGESSSIVDELRAWTKSWLSGVELDYE